MTSPLNATLHLLALLGLFMAASLTPQDVTLRGVATYYDDGPGRYGAAGPVLRKALGGDPAFRGKHVTVCAERCTTVVLSDWCACGPRNGEPTLIDLSTAAFKALSRDQSEKGRAAFLSRGVVSVRISVAGSEPQVTLPPTSTED